MTDTLEAGVSRIRQEAARLMQGEARLPESGMDEVLHAHIETLVMAHAAEWQLSIRERQIVVERVFNAMRRLDVLEGYMKDPAITEIMVNGPDAVFIEREGRLSRAPVRFESRERLEDLIQGIVARVNRSVNESEPIVDARLEDGSRINAILRPVALDGPLLTIRKFPDKPMTLERLTGLNAISPEVAHSLRQWVRARYNIFVCGGTGSGKTSLLNALAGCIPVDERIVTLEDSAELQLKTIENLARLETRNANAEGRGEIRMGALIRTALRMRPDRIIVGEVRGEEALDMLQAMNTGHDGSMSTGHANGIADMLSRLETMVLSAAPLPLEAIRKQIASALDIIVYLGRLRDKSRHVLAIAELVGLQDEEYVLNPLYTFLEEERDAEDPSQQDGLNVPSIRGGLEWSGQDMVHREKLETWGVGTWR